MRGFWEAVDATLAQLRRADSVEAVLDLCPGGVSDGFWPGDGDELLNVLVASGWRASAYQASYLWTATAPDGSALAYTEGDLHAIPRPAQP